MRCGISVPPREEKLNGFIEGKDWVGGAANTILSPQEHLSCRVQLLIVAVALIVFGLAGSTTASLRHRADLLSLPLLMLNLHVEVECWATQVCFAAHLADEVSGLDDGAA